MIRLTPHQLGKLKHCFGLDYARKPYRNYYHCNEPHPDWEDMCKKGYAEKVVKGEKEIIYHGTLEGLRKAFRTNVTQEYYDAIDA